MFMHSVFPLQRKLGGVSGGIRRNDQFKVLVVGGASSGKTAVFRRYLCNDFPYNYLPTSKVGVGVKLVG